MKMSKRFEPQASARHGDYIPDDLIHYFFEDERQWLGMQHAVNNHDKLVEFIKSWMLYLPTDVGVDADQFLKSIGEG